MTRPAPHMLAVLLAVTALTGGCEWIPERLRITLDNRQRQIDELRDQNRQLAKDNHQLRTAISDLQKQIGTLQDLGDKRLEKLFHVQRITLHRYTGGVDLDDKGGHDAIKVFLRPLDQDSDPIKAAGAVKIQLWDLARPQGETLVGEYDWPRDVLAKKWVGGFLTYHYVLPCVWKTPPKHEEITVRVEFTDYLTGRRFTAQKVCKIDLPAPPPATQPAATRPATTRPATTRPATTRPAAIQPAVKKGTFYFFGDW